MSYREENKLIIPHMTPQSARQRMAEWDAPSVHVLDEAKAKRLGAPTMLMPSPGQVANALRNIAAGETMTVKALRIALAKESDAGTACPVATKLCWKIAAEAAEEDRSEGVTDVTPWWRLTLEGKPNPRTPGGVARHRELLRAEGIEI